ncbi:NADPH--cytochrome P450 reductase-like isoform X1 [Argiope bruennichi]|uniref:NADPH--cytochrome P450 reductase-like isoform X1 n=1 Tax=Argiope bruennichi TaxID=94029 RepID=UPI0024951B89|nr:NADPH--cytochrome P450 reductase-like isoform X1 [Argiope bruennichi]XP_055936552.1 NADPH--cytochrome P450 reductase-like isoform X1 [Argiope bruennichi]
MAEKLEMHEIPKSATEESLIAQQHFGPIDICVIIAVISAVVYYMFFRKKKEINTFQITTHDYTSRDKAAQKPNHVTTSDSSFINKMKSTGRNVIVFYGSQTGTAEEFATRLAKEANRYGMKAMVADPEDYDMEDLCKVPEIENSLVIFCMATYGEGDPTDNAQEFYQWLQTGDGDLSGLNYAVFGLGNKTYEHYNSMGIYVDKRVEELGGTRVFELGLGDDDANIEEDFITWKERFWSAVCEHFHIETLGEDINLRQYELVVHEDLPPEKIFTGEISRLNSYKNQRPPYDMKNPFLSTVTVNRELYRGERSCMHIELDITDSRIRYDTGDHVAIYPTNDIALVEKLGKLLNADLDTVFSLNNLDEDSTKKHPFPCPTTYRTALLHYVDITSIPRTHVLKEISEYATDEEEKKMLKLMATSSEEGKKLYLSWVVKYCRSIIHILEDLPSLKPPIDHLLELLPRLQARYYSISSSPKLHASSIHITAVLVEYETPTKRITRGVATGWLKTLKPGDRVPIFVRRSQFRLPSKPHIPIIMIGPGTGLAPFRGFLQERSFQRKEGKEVGDSILYFGCRKSKEDFLYEDELKTFEEEGTLTKLHAAFSRDQPEKLYVTHLLNANKDELWRVFGESSGHIYVCGDARNMAKDVHNIILEIVQEYGKKTKDEAEAYIKKMESQRRYSADVWS